MATSDTTRLLVLGSACLFEPANGYQLRRELLSWEVESWAHVNPGSIYSMLSTLTRQGMLKRNDLAGAEGSRPIAVYTATPAGRRELLQLIRDGLTTVVHFDQTAFYAALSLMVPFFTRRDVITMLRKRMDVLAKMVAGMGEKIVAIDAEGASPPHVTRMIGYSAALFTSEREWLADFVADIEAGGLVFQGEKPMSAWKPHPDDPAWKMVREREAYLAQLGD